ncbi:MAG: DUF4325 domain-containing protein [Patescibacteria group bacterium]
MNIRSLILKRLAKQSVIRAAEVIRATGFSRTYVNRFFQQLTAEGKVMLIGRANQARYVLAEPRHITRARQHLTATRHLFDNKNLNEDVVLNNIKRSTGIFLGLARNVEQILDYAFTEMLNNAIGHSRSQKIEVNFRRESTFIRFQVVDRGIGIFNNIRQKRHLPTTLDAIQDLLKGKQTTAPDQHTGEGVFFTSKVADVLTILSADRKLTFDNIAGDVFIRHIKQKRGTRVTFTVNLRSKRNLERIFATYSGEAYGFTKTEVAVKLYELGSEYVSRSQAKRIMSGLEKFKHITLNFKGVETVGQGFADEVFRVWQSQHPGISIEAKNTNENVKFMIKRAGGKI